MKVVGPLDSPTPEALVAAVEWLRGEADTERVAIVTVGGASDAAFEVAAGSSELVDQLIAVGARGSTAALGPFPKLFIAAESDVAEAQAMALEAPGEWNESATVPDPPGPDDATIELILGRLAERR